MVHKALAGQKVKIERGKTETDEQLRDRVLQRMDPRWISEHDVGNAFRAAISKIDGLELEDEESHRPRL